MFKDNLKRSKKDKPVKVLCEKISEKGVVLEQTEFTLYFPHGNTFWREGNYSSPTYYIQEITDEKLKVEAENLKNDYLGYLINYENCHGLNKQ
jgi:hypothetical protein